MAGLVAVIVLDVAWLAFCYYQLIRYPAKVLPKPTWAILILVSSLLGGLAYLAAERWGDQHSNPPRRREGRRPGDRA